MPIVLIIHIIAGGLGLILGAVALSAEKGASLHRKSGILFVYAMLVMSLSGVTVAFLRGIETNAIGGLLAIYLLVTALVTVRPYLVELRWLNLGAMLIALAIGLASISVAIDLLLNGKFSRHGVPIPILLIFGSVALLATIGDLRMIWSRGIQGARRLARHLWRMCFAFFIATGSFFLGQVDVIPEPLRIQALLTTLALAPLLLMVYWLVRVRLKPILQKKFSGASQKKTSIQTGFTPHNPKEQS